MPVDETPLPDPTVLLASQISNYSEILENMPIPLDLFDDPILNEGAEEAAPNSRYATRSTKRKYDTESSRPRKLVKTQDACPTLSPTAEPSICQPLTSNTTALNSVARSLTSSAFSATLVSNDGTAVSSGYEEPVVIAYHHPLRGFVHKLPYGAQWEIARFINAGFPYEKFTVSALVDLAKLKGNAGAAPAVARLVNGGLFANQEGVQHEAFASAYVKEKSLKLPWEELDKEECVLGQSVHGGLGCNDDEPYLRDDPWYGGRVHFTAKVTLASNADTEDKKRTFVLKLDRPVLGTSNQFARRFGSRKFIRVRIAKDAYSRADKFGGEERLLNYFKRPFIVNQFVFRAFYAKEGNVFLFQTNEFWDGTRVCEPAPLSTSAFRRDFSFLDFIYFHNDLTRNEEQTMVKWAARFALGLSNSVPGIRLRPSNIGFEKDEVCSAWTGSGKVPNEQIMTDGCGLIRLDTMQRIMDRMKWSTLPTAIQMRICGSKGLLLTHPHSRDLRDGDACVWLRPSQIKIKHADAQGVPSHIDPAMLTIDVLRHSRMKTPACLSTETIINMSENGVPTRLFVDLMRESMRMKVAGLTTWDGEKGIYRLWENVARAGGVFSARLAREAAGSARAQGYIFEDTSDEVDDEDGFIDLNNALEEHSTAWWDDPISGCPSSLEETVLVLLTSGFLPDSCPVLAAKLKEVVKRVINGYVKRYRVEVPQSCSGFIVPDPLGILEPGEIHMKSSSRNLIDQDGRPTDIVTGDVLVRLLANCLTSHNNSSAPVKVTRHPCKVPTDVQKVKAVFCQQLSSYVDVIVISTKNHLFGDKRLDRHLASCTGGGDYDGDTMEVFWHPELVRSFSNAHPRLLEEPQLVQKCLVKNTETVAAFLQRNPPPTPKDVMISELQRYLLGALRDSSMVGMYSTWWENCIYKFGYDHDKTIFLAYMFCAILDGSKTGVTVSSNEFRSHQGEYAHRPPAWKETEDECRRYIQSGSNEANLRRPKQLSVFVMDEIHKEVNKASDEQMKHIEDVFTGRRVELDKHLIAPWNEAKARADRAERAGNPDFGVELKKIQDHVERIYRKWRTGRGGEEGRVGTTNNRKANNMKAGFTGLSIEKRQDKLRELSQEFHAAFDEDLTYFSNSELGRVRASYAYLYDYNTSREHWSRFPWDVAMRVLGEIKAGALGLSKAITEEFYTRMKVGSGFLQDR